MLATLVNEERKRKKKKRNDSRIIIIIMRHIEIDENIHTFVNRQGWGEKKKSFVNGSFDREREKIRFGFPRKGINDDTIKESEAHVFLSNVSTFIEPGGARGWRGWGGEGAREGKGGGTAFDDISRNC